MFIMSRVLFSLIDHYSEHVDTIKRRHDEVIRRGQHIIKKQDCYIVAKCSPF